MMKKNTIRMTALALTAAALFSLTACSGKGDTTPAGSGGVPSAGPQPGNTSAINLTMRDYVAQSGNVWLKLADPSYQGKDSKIERIFVLESNGALYTAPGDGMTLGDAAQMEDADIAAQVKAEYEARFENDYNGDLARIRWDYLGDTQLTYEVLNSVGLTEQLDESCLETKHIPQAMYQPILSLLNQMLTMATSSNEGLEVISVIVNDELFYLEDGVAQEVLMGYFAGHDQLLQMGQEILAAGDAAAQQLQDIMDGMEPEPGAYQLAIHTDATGNKTETMLFAYQTSGLSGEDVDSLELYYLHPAGSAATNCGNQVYDATYGGFGTGDGMLLTRIDSRFHFVLEEAADSDLPLDVEAEALFG